MIKKRRGSIENINIHLPKLDYVRHKVGIQIGEKRIKIVEVKKRRSHWETIKTITEELPKGMVHEGRVLQPDLLGLKIKEIFSNHRIKAKRVSVFIEELPIFVRHVGLPKMSKKELEKAIYYHAQLEIPVEPSELTIRYTLVEQDQSSETEQNEYSIFAVYSSLIENVVKSIEAAGLCLCSFGLEPDSIYQGLREKKIIVDTKNSCMIVRTDTQRMLLAIYKYEKMIYSRYVPFSLNRQDWEQEIQRTLVSWNGRNKNNPIKEVLLLGEKDSWDEVKERIENFMPLSVRLVTSPFTACLGISLIEPDKNNFYTDKQLLTFSQFSLTIRVLAPVVILAAIALSYVLVRPFLLQNEITELQEKIKQESEILTLVNREELLRTQTKNSLVVKEFIEAKHIDILALVQSVTSHQPEEVHLNQLAFSNDLLNISGESANQETVVSFFKGLQENPHFPNIQLTQSVKGDNRVQFTIEMNKNNVSEEQDGEETK